MPIFDNTTTWSYKTRHVQTKDGSPNFTDFDAGDFIRGASILIIAGPRRKPTPFIAAQLFPIGLLQTGSVQEQKQLEEVFEIGAEPRYFIDGRVFHSMQVTRIMVDSASLLRAMYNEASHAGQVVPAGNEPGFNDYYLNLASVFFNKPTGLLLVDKNSDGVTVGAAYLRDAKINNYNRNITATQTVVAEQCLVRFDRIEPIQLSELVGIIP